MGKTTYKEIPTGKGGKGSPATPQRSRSEVRDKIPEKMIKEELKKKAKEAPKELKK